MSTIIESQSDAKLKEDYVKISSWLIEMGFSGRPDYEINEELIEVLSLVMRTNQDICRDQLLLVQDLERRTREYEAETKRLDEMLIPRVISQDAILEDTVQSSSSLAKLAVALCLDDTSQTNYELEISKLVKNVLDAELEMERLESDTVMWAKKNKQLMTQIKDHKGILESMMADVALERERQENNEKELGFLSSKQADYNKRIKLFEKALEDMGMTPSLTHEQLKEDFEHLESVEKEVITLQSKLDGYKNLPADISLANVTIAEAKVRLETLNKEMDKHLNEFS